MSSTFDSFDSQLFSWESWSPEGPMSMQFSDVTLKVQVGDFAEGTKFPFAFILGEMSLLVLVDEQQEEHPFRLGLSVGAKVDTSELQHSDGCGCGHEH